MSLNLQNYYSGSKKNIIVMNH